jgi:hypothetical protein
LFCWMCSSEYKTFYVMLDITIHCWIYGSAWTALGLEFTYSL